MGAIDRIHQSMFKPSQLILSKRARAFGARHFLSLLGLVSLGAAAQSQLDPVVVTGTREPQPLSRSTADIVVISASTLRDTSATSLEELLRREAGLQITQNGGPGQSSGYLLRGANSSGTVVLIDGVRVGSASLGQAEFEAISLAQIDHIEVLRGPASSLYGADAVGGVIQIFTRKGDGALRVTGDAAVGRYNSRQGHAAVSGSSGAFDYAVSAGRASSDGVSAIRPNDRFGNYNPDLDGYARSTGNLRLGFAPAAGHRIGLNLIESRLNAQYDSAEYDANFNADASPDFRNHLTTRVAAVDYRGELSSLWTTTLQVAQNSDDSNSGGTTLTRYKTVREQATWQNALHLSADQQVVLAYEYLHEKVQGDVYPDEPQRRNHALVAGYSGAFGAAGVEASLRHDDNSVYGRNTTGNLGASYQVLPGLKLRALAGTTFRAPSFNDLYFPGYGVNPGNALDGRGVQPEKGRSVELGASWTAGATSASATVYRNKVRNLIGYDPDPNGTDCPAGFFGCAGNTARATLQGATLAASQRWGGLTVRGTLDFLDAKDDDTGVRLARRAAHQETIAADYDAGAWTAGASLLGVGARPDGGVDLGGYGVLDLRATWRFLPQWRVEARLLNALDHRIEPVRDYQGLGRQAWIGVRYDGAGL